ncbi:MAG: aminopeptidase P N-terminal domain-containing protein [Gemmatimonadetes bacterium]|nr:aminopeptidase P N-terminal domain-containing protein [Gemmatimonadota bacterium]
MRIVAPLLAFFIAACAASPQQGSTAANPARAVDVRLPALPTAAPITQAEYAARRSALLDSIGDGVLVIFGAPSPAADYLPFVQLADFRYLTGIMEPSAAYIAVKNGARVNEHLFVLDRNPAREVWEGARLGPDGARARTGINAQSIQRFDAVLDSLVRTTTVLHSTIAPPIDRSLSSNHSHAQQILSRIREANPDLAINTVQNLIRNQRGLKSTAELDRIRRAVYISALAHREAMRSTRPGMNEFEIRALMEYTFRRYGAEGPAYGSIVGSGPNSTTLHYQASDRFMESGEVLLIDAAASYGGYAADVTRTFPVNGTFTPDQRAIYEIVLAAQRAAAALIREGATWGELSAAASTELANGLARLGLIDSPDATYEPVAGRTQPQVRLFYMHGLGHGVGLAVHDPDISQTRGSFAPGSAVTIEPGIYVRSDVFDYLPDTPANRAMIQRLRPAAERYRNIGVRIEDVYIFDGNGVERVSAAAPQEIDEIEALMREPGLDDASRRGDMVDWFRGNRGR